MAQRVHEEDHGESVRGGLSVAGPTGSSPASGVRAPPGGREWTLAADAVLALQRSSGNAAVTRLLARSPPRGRPAPGRAPALAIQRIELVVPSLGRTLDHTELAKLKYEGMTPLQLSELLEKVDDAIEELTADPGAPPSTPVGDADSASSSVDPGELTSALTVAALGKAKPASAEMRALQWARNKINWLLQDMVKRIFGGALSAVGETARKAGIYIVEMKEYTAEELAGELHVSVEDMRRAPPGRYPSIPDLLKVLEGLGLPRVGFPPTLPASEADEFADKFTHAHDAEFLEVLKDFRANPNPSPNVEFAGGEGQIYLSDGSPTRCLKRWYASRTGDLDRSVGYLTEARDAVLADEVLPASLVVVQVHRRGSDWIVRDFDPTSIRLKRARGDEQVDRAVAAVLGRLEETAKLPNVRKKVQQSSDNVHWSPTLKRILVIDLL